ncbi:MAG TPA: site-specific DNA-methyltransferase [Syntrophomonadaceae bacterium]|nr:site-specific DNA-methyltransferase [Syntrophomonadaceae bacterium]
MIMQNSLITKLPQIAVAGRKEAVKIIERVECSQGVSLQIDEYVQPLMFGNIVENGAVPVGEWCNRLLYGDNLVLMEALLAGDPATGLLPLKGKIDLIYIDPPYASRSNYLTRCTLPGCKGTFVLEQQAFTDTWEEGMAGYLRMLYPRLLLMRELLSEKGSLIVHLDWHAAHYVKVLLDDIYGRENFRNEIAWCYGGGGAPKNTYPKKHDLLLWYTKGSTWTFNRQFRPYTQGTLERGLTAVKGDQYKLRKEGAGLDDWWAGKDVQKILSPTAYENLKFNTQKPEGLLKRIISGHSNKGDLIADFFCGTGTTGAAAEKLGRRWIMADSSKLAFMIAYKRLLAQQSKPFFSQSRHDCTYPSCGRLELKKSVVRSSAGMDEITVELGDYIIPAQVHLPLPVKVREQIQELITADPLALIEYWMVDPDYDGKVFHSKWQSCRGQRGEDLRVDSRAILLVPKVVGTRKICVKAVDVFGCESMASQIVSN